MMLYIYIIIKNNGNIAKLKKPLREVQKMIRLTVVLVMMTVAFSMNAQKKTNKAELFDMSLSVDKQKKLYKSKVEAQSIKFRDGSVIKLGDTLIVGGSANKISNAYTTLQVGRYSLGMAIAGSVPVMYGLTIKGTKVVIDKIRVWRTMGRVVVMADLKQLEVGKGAMFSYVGCLNFEIAVTEGEIINPNAPMTRDQAIAKLKEAKELLDLDLMSKEEFNEIKEGVTSIIKGI